MKIRDFGLETFFEKYEFTAPYLLTQSDCETMSTKEILALEPGSEEEYLNLRLGYSETWGDPELREIIAGLYKTMSKEDVFVIHGAQEGIFAYMNVMLDEGDHMIAQFPNYQAAYEVANSVPGASYSKWMVKDNGSGWYVDFDELEALIQPNTKLIAVNTPDNPTGYTMTNAEIQKLIDICRKHDLYLFSDEVYKGVELDGEKRDWVADHYEKAVSLGVMSKAYGLAGLRVGWIVSKDHDILKKMARYKNYLSICDSVPSEYLTKIALKHSDEILEKTRKLIQKHVEIGNEFFARHGDLFENKPPMAGPVAFHKLKIDMPVADFCQLAVDKKGVLLLPATIYEVDEQYFRMGYGRANFPEALAKFEEFLYEEGFAK
ncbi:MAG: aminotransferase class I/II-fold pyridoxal phosphate-dependent enzyme [Firmicutes bacterium]|nr:aminotransferase class I/II-fold pyridoxal phosphate-dependent enzyme [Bacillota bacterium]MBQ5955195.1 aminotransferase class I/II-fold pyridoxal phosphate-dependent enzyme [Bacillota bacterium]